MEKGNCSDEAEETLDVFDRKAHFWIYIVRRDNMDRMADTTSADAND